MYGLGTRTGSIMNEEFITFAGITITGNNKVFHHLIDLKEWGRFLLTIFLV